MHPGTLRSWEWRGARLVPVCALVTSRRHQKAIAAMHRVARASEGALGLPGGREGAQRGAGPRGSAPAAPLGPSRLLVA